MNELQLRLQVQAQENRSQGIKEHHSTLPSITLWKHTKAHESHDYCPREMAQSKSYILQMIDAFIDEQMDCIPSCCYTF